MITLGISIGHRIQIERQLSSIMEKKQLKDQINNNIEKVNCENNRK